MSDFNLHTFLTEHKLTRNSVLLENDNAPSFTPKEMKNFNSTSVEYNGETDKYINPIIIYQGHKYQLEYYDQDMEDSDGEGNGFGSIWFHTSKIPDTYFKFSAGFQYEGEGSWVLTDLDDLEQVEVNPSWEIDHDSDKIPDEEEFDFGDELDERDIKGKEEKIVKALKKTGKYKKDDPELYKLAAGITKKNKNMNEEQGEELTQDIALIGGTLKKIETMLDFGRDQDPEVEEGLQTVLNILIDIQHKLESETRNSAGLGGASQFYQMENILKQMGK
jgi:hypothetical protein